MIDQEPISVSPSAMLMERDILLWLIDQRTGDRIDFGPVDESSIAGPNSVNLRWTRIVPWIVGGQPTWDSEWVEYVTPWSPLRQLRLNTHLRVYPDDTLTVTLTVSVNG